MKCDEVQSLQGPYLDSELDARTTLQIEQHLKACAACARFFAEEEKLEARMKAGLNQGERTASLWEHIERSVAGAHPAAQQRAWRDNEQPAVWRTLISVLSAQIRAGWRRSPRAWTGLAAAWAVIFLLNLSAREPEPSVTAARTIPSASEVRLALRQRQMMMVELAAPVEPVSAIKPKGAAPGPRSDGRRGNRSV